MKKDQTMWTFLIPLNTYYTAALNFKNHRLQKRYQEKSSPISGKIASWAKRMDVQMKETFFELQDPILVLSILASFKTASDRNSIQNDSVIGCWHFSFANPPKHLGHTEWLLTTSRISKKRANLIRTDKWLNTCWICMTQTTSSLKTKLKLSPLNILPWRLPYVIHKFSGNSTLTWPRIRQVEVQRYLHWRLTYVYCLFYACVPESTQISYIKKLDASRDNNSHITILFA